MFTSLWFFALLGGAALARFRLPGVPYWKIVLAVSLVGFAAVTPGGLVAAVGSTAAVWQCARRLERARQAAPGTARAGRGWLLSGGAACLAPLAAFKYLGLGSLVLPGGGSLRWLVPLGLSYYSLQLLGYLLDVQNGRLPAEPRFGRLLTYALFFLSITQGPFNRYDDLMPQLDAPCAWEPRRLSFGLQRMAWGYFQKFAVADRLAICADAIFSGYAGMDASQLVFGVLAYSIQLYADFAGYTNLALGAGELLGLRLPENFVQPYFAQSVSDFWRRWHRSLSFWFRDYVYIGLGGNRRGLACQLRNLLAVWVLTGIWHGAGTGFLAWGLYYFVLLAASRLAFGGKGKNEPAPGWLRALRALRTSALACFGWLLFRAGTLGAAAAYLRAMAANPGGGVFARYWEMGLTSRTELLLLFAGVALLFAVDLLHERGHALRAELASRALPVRWAVCEFSLWAFLLMGVFLSGGSGFLYARF